MRLSELTRNLIIILALTLISCEKYEDPGYLPISLEECSIPYDIKDNGFLLTAKVPSSDSTIILVPHSKNGISPLITSLSVNGSEMSESDSLDGDDPYLEGRPILMGEWGEINYENIHGKFTIVIHLNRDCSTCDKCVKFRLGYGYEYVDMEIIQMKSD
ncbi:MAG: hypothetical protein K2H61_10030 [Muribaculaceae bacterium]|nr:hypothetical protein [Muribaculaceae bacterium]